MKGIIVILSGQVFVGSLKGFGGEWVGSEKSFRRKDWKTRTEYWTPPYLHLEVNSYVIMHFGMEYCNTC